MDLKSFGFIVSYFGIGSCLMSYVSLFVLYSDLGLPDSIFFAYIGISGGGGCYSGSGISLVLM